MKKILPALCLLASLLPVQAARAEESVFLEDLTSPEVKALIEAGARTALVPVGGTEQNGPHMVLGKHNRIVQFTAGEIARRLGGALVAPVLPFAPEGSLNPPKENMAFAGTLGISERALALVLEGVARSLKLHGFTTIAFLGDHGGSQAVQAALARKLSAEWAAQGVKVLHLGHYYGPANGQMAMLTEAGADPARVGYHAGLRDTSELMAIAPEGIRFEKLEVSGPWETSGVDGDPSQALPELGEELLALKIEATLSQISASR
jgi:creatinine amidohydrolase